MLRLLVAEGNIAADRRWIAKFVGATPGERYADVLTSIARDASVDICAPGDQGMDPPKALDSYHGVVVTGSALNIYKRERGSLRQIEFMREAFAHGIPIFGSCWGLQLAAVAAGGEVGPNPRGREVAFARKIMLTDAGRNHEMHGGRPVSFDAPAIHGDELVRPPDSTTVTAWNEMSAIQAAEIRFERGVFWGVQYHPEYDLLDVATTLQRYGTRLVEEGFFADDTIRKNYADDLLALNDDRARKDIAWQMGLGADVLDAKKRHCEIINWIDRQVRPYASK